VSRSRAACAATLGVALAALVTGCSGGFDTPLYKAYSPGEGANSEAGSIKIRNVVLVAPESGGPAAVVAAFYNESGQADQLVDVAIQGAEQPGTVTPSPLELPAGELVLVGGTDADAQATVTGPADQLAPGNFVPVQLSFRDAGTATVNVLVQPQAAPYATISPAPPTPPAATPVGIPTPTELTAEPTVAPTPTG
jgi:copper(I)-binding protein